MKYISYTPSRPPGLLQRSAAVVGMSVLAGVALMFSAVLLAIMLGMVAVIMAWLWWNTRGLRRQMRERMKDAQQAGAGIEHEILRGTSHQGVVIEGVAVRVDKGTDTR